MSAEIRELVTARWAEYGIATDPRQRNGALRHSSRRMLRR